MKAVTTNLAMLIWPMLLGCGPSSTTETVVGAALLGQPCDASIGETRCAGESSIAVCSATDAGGVWRFHRSCGLRRCDEIHYDGSWSAGCACENEEGPGAAGTPCMNTFACAKWTCTCGDAIAGEPQGSFSSCEGDNGATFCEDGLVLCLKQCAGRGGLTTCRRAP
jgi:hypothetical protein